MYGADAPRTTEEFVGFSSDKFLRENRRQGSKTEKTTLNKYPVTACRLGGNLKRLPMHSHRSFIGASPTGCRFGYNDRMRTAAGLSLTPRLGYAAGFVICAGLIGFALYLQYFQEQDPCPLCILQRMVYMALMAVFLVAALHGPGRTGAMVYGSILFVVAGVGMAIAGRHVWLQHLPKDRVPECGPGLEYMLRKYSPFRALEKILAGSGECAESGWSFLGLTIAGWSLVWFVLLGAFAAYLAFAAMRRNH